MKITITFDSAEEFLQHIRVGQQQDQIMPEPEPQEPAGAAEVPFTEDKPAEPENPVEKAPSVSVEEVRKLLADLNKRAGKNVAKDLIKAAGYKKLTDVPAEKLPELKAAAEKEAETYA